MQEYKYKSVIAEPNLLTAAWLPVFGGVVGGTGRHKSSSWEAAISREVNDDDDDKEDW